MRRLFGYFCIALVLTALFGIYPMFYFFQMEAKMHAHKMLEQSTAGGLVCIELTPENFELALIEEHELLIEGRMFDAREIVREKDKVIVKGIYDDKETALLARMVSFVHHKESDGLTDLGDFFAQQLFVDEVETNVFGLNVLSLHMPHVVVALIVRLQPVNSPPPDLLPV